MELSFQPTRQLDQSLDNLPHRCQPVALGWIAAHLGRVNGVPVVAAEESWSEENEASVPLAWGSELGGRHVTGPLAKHSDYVNWERLELVSWWQNN